MRPVIAVSAVCAILALVLVAGCTSTSAPVPATTIIITPQPTAVPATAVPAATPGVMTIATTTTSSGDNGAIEVMPPAQQVNLVLSKDRPTSQLHLIYQGGPGEMFTQKVSMKVYASDGTVEEYTMSGGQKPLPNDEIVATGTRSGDRCVVYVQSAGTIYKLMDETVYSAGEYRV